MRKNPDHRLASVEPDCGNPAGAEARWANARQSAPDRALRMREQLAGFLARAVQGSLPVRVPGVPGNGVARGDGHFHLAAELFLQVTGWTEFRFPHTTLRLHAGEALVLPPRLLHAEHIGGGTPAAPFCNIVVYAEGPALTCHLAHEVEPGTPGIQHLEAQRHVQAPRVHDWLIDAARLGRAADVSSNEISGGNDGANTDSTSGSRAAAALDMAALQARALVSAALAGVLRALDEPDPQARPEPALVARARVLVNNQLGDPGLSVRGLADQAGCTADYLSHVFRQASGEALAAFIVRQRMERAAHLLAQSALAGKEVAWACGFATQSYFVRSFRAHHGVTPQAWRAARALAPG